MQNLHVYMHKSAVDSKMASIKELRYPSKLNIYLFEQRQKVKKQTSPLEKMVHQLHIKTRS